MSMINRYEFTKKIYPNYVVIILVEKNRKRKYYTYGIDEDILKYLKFKNSTKILKKKNINYIVLDNITIDEMNECLDNKYERYKNIIYLSKIIDKIGNKLKGNY